ncbi:MAG: lipopolysaccharide assembly protein LapB [Gammaproteobacteria bacterium]|jgi:lipopolysaccharide biosynthesis regulator YciM
MPTDSRLLLGGLLFVAVAAGWLLGRIRPRRNGREGGGVSAEYFRGLNYLLNEQPDKAIEVFIRMVEVDSETVETHFALGSLFRRRGEVDRAIRIHQNLIARPNLNRNHRYQALFALGEDYMRAGLFDRAENLFLELADVRAHMEPALRSLVTIYEQQKDWEQAITMCRRLEMATGVSQHEVIAQYYCELADARLAVHDLKQCRKYLKRAQTFDRDCVRACIMQATVARLEDKPRTAVRNLRRALELDIELAADVLGTLYRLFRDIKNPDGFTETLEELRDDSEEATTQIALAAIIDPSIKDPVARECVAHYLRESPGLRGLSELIELLTDEDLEQSGPATERLLAALRHFLETGPRYRCRECGFTGKALLWQCPSCKTWNSTRARFDIALPILPTVSNAGHSVRV